MHTSVSVPADAACTPIFTLSGITFAYPFARPILNGIDLSLSAGERIGLAAPNGSGKSTLLRIIMGLLTPASGTVTLFGRTCTREKAFRAVRHRIGLLFQDADDQLFSPTVLEDVAFGPLNLGKSKAAAKEIALQTLDRLGLSGFEDRITFTLSGGEKKRVSLATILAMEPEALLLDEPTGGLDAHARQQLVDILSGLDLPSLIISHDPDFLSATTTRLLTLNNGKISQEVEIHTHAHIHPHIGHVH